MAVCERLWLPEVYSGCPRKVLSAGGLCGWTDAICERPVSSIDSLALVSTRSGTKLVRNSFAHFLTRLEKTSPSVQCVAKYRRSQMSIPKSGRPHMAGLLMTQKIRWQNCYITSKMLYCYMSDDCICYRQYLSMYCSYIIAECLCSILLTSHETIKFSDEFQNQNMHKKQNTVWGSSFGS